MKKAICIILAVAGGHLLYPPYPAPRPQGDVSRGQHSYGWQSNFCQRGHHPLL